MAVLNPLLGRLKGKYGGSVFYSNSGTQCMRERVLEVGNPKTSKQAIQRAILATITQFTRAFAPVLNNSIESITGRNKTLAKIRSINMDLLRRLAAEAITGGFYTPKGSLVIAPNDYLISRGTLRGLSPIRDSVSRAALANGALQFVDSDLVLGASVTASQMFPTITPGDQITILAASLEDIEVGSYSGYCRFAFKDDVTPALVVESDSIYMLNDEAVDLTKAAGPWRSLRFTAATTGTRNVIQVGGVFGEAADEHTDLAGVIVSRESQRLRSTSYMLSVDTFPGFTLDEVYPTYMAGGAPIDMPSEVYLNNDASASVANPYTDVYLYSDGEPVTAPIDITGDTVLGVIGGSFNIDGGVLVRYYTRGGSTSTGSTPIDGEAHGTNAGLWTVDPVTRRVSVNYDGSVSLVITKMILAAGGKSYSILS